MKIFVSGCTFDASAGEITFPGTITPTLERILLIANTTDNIIIYNFADPALGGTVAAQVLTLTFDTSAMADGDALLVYYDSAAGTPENVYLANGAIATLMGAELNTLANAAGVLATNAFDNSAAATHWPWGDFELVCTSTSAMTAGATVDLYFAVAPDGTNYSDSANANGFIGSFVCLAATAQRAVLRGIPLPPALFKCYLVNNSGQAFLSVNTLKVLPYRIQGAA